MDDGNKSNNNNKSANEKATQAYKLFSEGKKPVEVAIQLNLSEKEATRFYTEYWRLKRLYSLYQIPVSNLPGIKRRSFLYSEAIQVSKKDME